MKGRSPRRGLNRLTAKEMDRLRRIEVLFDAALEHPPGEKRDAWLREQCTTDADMLAEVRRLLKNALVSAVAPVAAEALQAFGPWQAIRLLGRGGMGPVVQMATPVYPDDCAP